MDSPRATHSLFRRCRARLVPRAAAALLILGALSPGARAEETAPPRFLVLHDGLEGEPRQRVLTRLIEHTGESPTLDWMAIDDLAGLWAADSLDVRAPSVDSCEGGIAEAAAMPAFTKAVITHLEAGRPDEARARLDRAESTWPCLDGAAARPDLQLIALLRAWLEFEVSNAEAFEDAIRQAVAFSPTLPGALEPTLPAEGSPTLRPSCQQPAAAAGSCRCPARRPRGSGSRGRLPLRGPARTRASVAAGGAAPPIRSR